MKVGIYYTNGEFAFGNIFHDVDKEFIWEIDSAEVWLYIKFIGDNKIRMALRFDDVKPPHMERFQRCVVIAEQHGYKDAVTVYKEIILKFNKLLRENGWEWRESADADEVDKLTPKVIDVDVRGKRVEGIITNYPTIEDRLSMTKLAERIRKSMMYRVFCIVYSGFKPNHPNLTDCFWITSRRLSDIDLRFEKLEALKNALENEDFRKIKELSTESDFIDLIEKLDDYRVGDLFRKFNYIIYEVFKRSDRYVKQRILKLSKRANFNKYIKNLASDFGIILAPIRSIEQKRMVEKSRYNKRRRLILTMLPILALIVSSMIVSKMMFSSVIALDIDVTPKRANEENNINIKITNLHDKNINVLSLNVSIYNTTNNLQDSENFSINFDLGKNDTIRKNISWIPIANGTYKIEATVCYVIDKRLDNKTETKTGSDTTMLMNYLNCTQRCVTTTKTVYIGEQPSGIQSFIQDVFNYISKLLG